MSIVPTGGGAPQPPNPNRMSVPSGSLGQLGDAGNSSQPSFDILGALMRRKFVILVLAALGALLGWLNHAKQPDVYSSWLKVMVWTKSMPIMIDGDRVLKSVSLNKQQNLISSELVLKRAVQMGNLKSLPSLRGSNTGVPELKKMLTVSSMVKADDTLVLTCDGPNAEDLPIILNSIVEAYCSELDETYRKEKASAAQLIEDLQKELVDKNGEDKRRFLALIEEVGDVGTASRTGEYTNPHSVQLVQLKTELTKSRRAYKDVLARINMIRSSLYSNDVNRKKILAIESRKFLGLTDLANSDQIYQQRLDSSFQTGNNQRIFALEQRVIEMKIEEKRLSRVFGPAHRSLQHVRTQIKFWEQQLADAEQEQKEFEEKIPSEVAVADDETKKREEQRWITLYSVALDRERERLAANVSSVEEDVAVTEEKAAKISHLVAEINVLKRKISEKSDAVRAIENQLGEIKVLQESNQTNAIQVSKIDEPKNGRKIAPVFAKNLGYGIFLGIITGTLLALVIDRLDMSFRTPSEIIAELGIPVVGKIPRIGTINSTENMRTPTLVAAHKANSSAAEAFRAARTSLFFASQKNQYSTFLITSPSPGDGKSTVASNLAISIAQTGKTVVLIDADFRRPRIHTYFDHPIEPGSVDILNADSDIEDAVIPTLQENLSVLSAGGRPKNPGELVTSAEFSKLIEDLKTRYDYVLIDSPPLLPVADSTVMASLVDGVYIVMRIRKGVRVSATSAKEKLDQVNANVLGVIVNGMDQNPHYSEYGYYYYTYSSEYGRYYDSNARIESDGNVPATPSRSRKSPIA